MNQDDMQKRFSPAENREAKKHRHILFHPDYTVGPGVTPDLLTLFGLNQRSARGLYRRWGITPRPENKAKQHCPALAS
jgi:hypothetical protein